MGVAVPTWVTLPVISRACAANAASGAIARKRESDTANRRRTDAPRRDGEMVGVFGRQIRRVLRPPKNDRGDGDSAYTCMAIQPGGGPLRHTNLLDVSRGGTPCQERCKRLCAVHTLSNF